MSVTHFQRHPSGALSSLSIAKFKGALSLSLRLSQQSTQQAMASLVRRHPKTAILAATATCLICLPILVPLLLISSPFLFFTSLFSVGLMTLFRSLLRLIHLSFSLQRRITSNNRRRLRMQQFADNEGDGSAEDVHMREEGFLKQSRVHEYLEDQLKNLNVEALERSESGEDPLPCSFSFGPLESLNASFLCQEEG